MKPTIIARAAMLACILSLSTFTAWAQQDAFADGWTLDGAASSLTFLSIKDASKVETSRFATLEGEIDENGAARIVVHLESVDTKIDLRNVRMRFLFFETFLHPQATISAQIDPASLTALPDKRRITIPLPYTLDLHGIQKGFETEVVVTLLSEDRVAISTPQPITVSVADFALGDGLKKLEEAAGLPINPFGTVSFDFIFTRNGSGAGTEAERTAPAPQNVALESSGDLAPEECRNRFQTMSEANEISFNSGSARLQESSTPVLDSLVEIINRCPGLLVEVGGHTDAIGPDQLNQILSERRAASVAAYLTAKGIAADRFRTVGYGETQPVAENDTERGRWRNRRIAFTIIDG